MIWQGQSPLHRLQMGTRRPTPRGASRARVIVALLCACLLLVLPVAAKKKGKRKDEPRLSLLSRTLPRAVLAGTPIVIHARIEPGSTKGGEAPTLVQQLARGEAETGAVVGDVTLIQRFGFGQETRVAMRDDGVSPDLYAGDGVYVATIRTGDQGWPGGMVRWRAEAAFAPTPPPAGFSSSSSSSPPSTKGLLLRAPAHTSTKSPKYYGTVLGGRNHSTMLDVMDVFSSDVGAMTTDDGTQVSLAFRGRFYDNVKVRRRGSGRTESVVGVILPPKDWPKHKLKFDFKGEDFHWSKSAPPVEEFNLQSHYQEPGEETYMRPTLASAVFNAAGVPAPAVFHLQVRLNGAYHGLYSFVEQVDTTFLKRVGLDPRGDMYKAAHWKYSNLRAPDMSATCPWATPDWPEKWAKRDGYCPEVWRVVGAGAAAKANKAANDMEEEAAEVGDAAPGAVATVAALKYAAMAPLQELTATLERAAVWGAAAAVRRAADAADGDSDIDDDDLGARLLLDALDIPAVINEMAAQTLVLSTDRCTKNYYVHRDRKTLEWRRIPWDLEDSFPVDYRDGIRACDAATQCAANETDYCLLTCAKFNSVFFCDKDHPQDIFVSDKPGDESRTTYNDMVEAVLTSPGTRSMYLRRLHPHGRLPGH